MSSPIPVFAFLAVLCTAVGAIGFYLASPQQQLIAALAHARSVCLGALALLALGMVLWARLSHPAVGIFSALTLTMGVWIALPYAAAWRTAAASGRSLAQHGKDR